MANLKNLLKTMGDEIDGVNLIGVFGMDGIAVALHNPNGSDANALAAKFAMVMKLLQKSVADLKDVGDMEENLVQAEKAWIMTRFLNNNYYLGVSVGRDSTLGNVRLVTGKYANLIAKEIA